MLMLTVVILNVIMLNVIAPRRDQQLIGIFFVDEKREKREIERERRERGREKREGEKERGREREGNKKNCSNFIFPLKEFSFF